MAMNMHTTKMTEIVAHPWIRESLSALWKTPKFLVQIELLIMHKHKNLSQKF